MRPLRFLFEVHLLCWEKLRATATNIPFLAQLFGETDVILQWKGPVVQDLTKLCHRWTFLGLKDNVLDDKMVIKNWIFVRKFTKYIFQPIRILDFVVSKVFLEFLMSISFNCRQEWARQLCPKASASGWSFSVRLAYSQTVAVCVHYCVTVVDWPRCVLPEKTNENE